jgi:hypothetical protein
VRIALAGAPISQRQNAARGLRMDIFRTPLRYALSAFEEGTEIRYAAMNGEFQTLIVEAAHNHAVSTVDQRHRIAGAA